MSMSHPLKWMPTSYLTMGLVYVTVGSMANVMFKNVGFANDQAAFWSSLLGLPYIIKPLWAPLLELSRTKKFFVVLMQLLLGGLIAGAGLSLQLPGSSFTLPVLLFLALAAFAGATQDIASDGIYVTTLDARSQARFTGIQSMSWNLGPILAMGLLVRVSGTLHERLGGTGWRTPWTIVLCAIGGLVLVMALYHARQLPPGARPDDISPSERTFAHAFATFFRKPYIWRMVAFAFLYRLGMGLLDKVGPLFMIDAR